MEATVICGNAEDYSFATDMILTDPPFDMKGDELYKILERYKAPHLILISSMRQILEFMSCGGWEFRFDFVLDSVTPKKSISHQQPNYTHVNGLYLTRPGVKSVFSRRMRQRSDIYEHTGYWPTIFRAPRNRMHENGKAKNEQIIADLLGSFDIQSVLDPFAGSGSTALAAVEVYVDCIMIEKDQELTDNIKKKLKFFGIKVKE